jgi:hypothetical protein
MIAEAVNLWAQWLLVVLGFVVAAFEIFSDKFHKGQRKHNALRATKIFVGFLIAALGVVTLLSGKHLGDIQDRTLSDARSEIQKLRAMQKGRAEILEENLVPIVDTIRRMKPRTVVSSFNQGDVEAIRFAERFLPLFELSGCIVTKTINRLERGEFSTVYEGLTLFISDQTNAPQDIVELVECLKASGIHAQTKVLHEYLKRPYDDSKEFIIHIGKQIK